MKVSEYLHSIIGNNFDKDMSDISSTVEPGNTTTLTQPDVLTNTDAVNNNETYTTLTQNETSNTQVATKEQEQIAALQKEIADLKAANYALLNKTVVEKEPSVEECIYQLVGGKIDGK